MSVEYQWPRKTNKLIRRSLVKPYRIHSASTVAQHYFPLKDEQDTLSSPVGLQLFFRRARSIRQEENKFFRITYSIKKKGETMTLDKRKKMSYKKSKNYVSALKIGIQNIAFNWAWTHQTRKKWTENIEIKCLTRKSALNVMNFNLGSRSNC